MSLFRRVTRYRISPTQDPRENRLTEVTAAVLERVDGLAVQLERLRELDRPRLVVDTQVTTASAKFVDLELRFSPRPFQPGETCLFWVEVKHGANVHGTQLTDYETDIRLKAADQRLVLVLAPRQSADELVGVPDTMPVVDWQAIAEVVRRWAKRSDVPEVERFLLTDYLTYLREEGLMDEELTDRRARLRAARGARGHHHGREGHGARRRLRRRALGPARRQARRPQPSVWPGLLGALRARATRRRSGPRNMAQHHIRVGPVRRPGPRRASERLCVRGRRDLLRRSRRPGEGGRERRLARRQDGFEHVAIYYWRLFRFRYPEELLAATTLDAQVEALGSWVVETFMLLADPPPPH